MLRIALTGGIATGKSYVLDRLRERGVPCIDADELAHGVTAAGTEASAAIAERFGADILDAAGAVNRGRLGPIVFADKDARRDLEAIVHPGVYRAIQAGLRGFELVGARVAVAAIPLLDETGGRALFSKVIATLCASDVQMQRMLERGMSEADARARLAAQLPADEKARRADYVITTDGSFDATNQQIDGVLKSLIPVP
ncbi:MAG TPA: dephospho-CoA kinase [Vicinamibacterales bacterium]|jgi:dephospho-CoA kinase|nr:dephospho-CoA kinase [Vicinamibacterales bacterium]